ncbi:protein LITTLE ZIPPER 4-like [Iris pallida]|uniref:Protein LITTLE ZIPPER 4-like n=1 Tax=Iris pallida TaxID=29817 RepID=A0AAX6DGV2_IRIPA|nr:protein LITTLE ZIPPER 4-like [Iris pallida]KAJ6794558.1 protein LITTLE ZIPPER 4-like [Iris pallida]
MTILEFLKLLCTSSLENLVLVYWLLFLPLLPNYCVLQVCFVLQCLQTFLLELPLKQSKHYQPPQPPVTIAYNPIYSLFL